MVQTELRLHFEQEQEQRALVPCELARVVEVGIEENEGRPGRVVLESYPRHSPHTVRIPAKTGRFGRL